jgi:hypothetical protein
VFKKQWISIFLVLFLAMSTFSEGVHAAGDYAYSKRGVVSSTLQLEHPVKGNTEKNSGLNWAEVSPVSQFIDKNGGFAFAYESQNMVCVVTGSGTVSIPKAYPMLGAVTADSDGNIYIVWGRNNETDDATVETVFISKYTEDGKLVKTTGFVGKVGGWYTGDKWLTKYPFDAGNCDVVIADGILMCNYAREMYSGHQSNNVAAVRISDMLPSLSYTSPVPYSSHSFDQRVIYYKKTGEFIFADHGDAYPRGFSVSTLNHELVPFHFYLRGNANYNMYIVNKTFAQLGGLAETSRGLALVGASAKTLGAAAENETQNVFIQIFDPTASRLSADIFVTKGDRSGEMSTDLNDNSGKPLTPVADYGVQWLTDYTEDYRAVAPQVVATDDDRLVVLWEKHSFNRYQFVDSCYMVLGADGSVLKGPESLGGIRLNGNEMPRYVDGAVCWVTSSWNKAEMHRLILEDKPSTWAKSDVSRAEKLGLVPAKLQTDYSGSITRGEFCKLAIPIYEKLKVTITPSSSFADTSDLDVLKAATIGLVNGVGDKRFNPDGLLTRQEAAVILSRLLSLCGEKAAAADLQYTDSTQIADWASEAVVHVTKAGVMKGVSGNSFQPMGTYTREQAIVTLIRVWDILQKN